MTDIDVDEPTRDDDGRIVVDARGMACPRPVIELARAVGEATIGDELRLLADDPAAGVDVPVWCRMQRQTLLAQDEDGTALVFLVRKARDI